MESSPVVHIMNTTYFSADPLGPSPEHQEYLLTIACSINFNRWHLMNHRQKYAWYQDKEIPWTHLEISVSKGSLLYILSKYCTLQTSKPASNNQTILMTSVSNVIIYSFNMFKKFFNNISSACDLLWCSFLVNVCRPPINVWNDREIVNKWDSWNVDRK